MSNQFVAPSPSILACWTCHGTGLIAWCGWICGYCGGSGRQPIYSTTTNVPGPWTATVRADSASP